MDDFCFFFHSYVYIICLATKFDGIRFFKKRLVFMDFIWFWIVILKGNNVNFNFFGIGIIINNSYFPNGHYRMILGNIKLVSTKIILKYNLALFQLWLYHCKLPKGRILFRWRALARGRKFICFFFTFVVGDIPFLIL